MPEFKVFNPTVLAQFGSMGCLMSDREGHLWWFDAEKKTVFKVAEDPDAAVPVTCSQRPERSTDLDDEIPF